MIRHDLKYNNYKILFNKLNEENKRKVELSEQLKELSPRMQMKLNELVEIKSKILESKNLSFNYEETKMYFLITLKGHWGLLYLSYLMVVQVYLSL